MDSLIRFISLFALGAAFAVTAPAAADYDGPDGYGGSTGYGFDVPHDGYQREGQTGATPDATTYVVIEAEDGTTEVVDGETVIVVQEPEPLAATEQAPPAPQTVVVVQPEVQCPGAIWVDGYWAYSNGDYVWVDGHCVVERVNYVFVQPRWDYYSNVWWFVPGYYRPWGVYVGFGYYRPWHWYPPYYHSYYRTRHPVPVNRGVPYRPTTVRARPPAVRSSRGIVRPTGSVGRAHTGPTRTQPVTRAPSRRTGTVTRAPSTRTGTVTRTRTQHEPRSTRSTASGRRLRERRSSIGLLARPQQRAQSVAPEADPRSRGRSRDRAPTTPSVSQPRVSPSRTSSVRRQRASTPSPARINRPAGAVRARADPAQRPRRGRTVRLGASADRALARRVRAIGGRVQAEASGGHPQGVLGGPAACPPPGR